jgi:hypothetical protein
VKEMNMFQAGLVDVYDNIEKRLGNKAWVLPIAVGLGSFLVSKALMHKSTGKSLMSAAMNSVTTAGLVSAGKSAKTSVAMS